jgi:hypothetical protein
MEAGILYNVPMKKWRLVPLLKPRSPNHEVYLSNRKGTIRERWKATHSGDRSADESAIRELPPRLQIREEKAARRLTVR